MSSLILAIRNRIKKNIPIQRVQQRKTLFAYELGKTLAFVCTTVFLFTTLIALPVPFRIITFFFLLFVTYSGVGSVLWVAGLTILFFVVPGAIALTNLGTIYLTAFLYGAMLALFYNDAVNLFRWISNLAGWSPQKTVFIHELDKNLPLQVIKSPIETEITSESFRELEPQEKLYSFLLGDVIPQHPFTILFVANPVIANPNKQPPTPDPIINNRDLFLRAVDDALLSFESNEIVGHPDIWPYIRVLTLFDENLSSKNFQDNDYALLQSFGNDFILDGKIVTHLIYPKQEMVPILDSIALQSQYKTQWNKYKSDIDVIFALSASEKYTRSLAYFSTFHKEKEKGTGFRFHHLSPPTKGRAYSAFSPVTLKHEYHAGSPGVVALNILGARNKTYIHEFAHAMSSTHNGAIVDEYYDNIIVSDTKPPGENTGPREKSDPIKVQSEPIKSEQKESYTVTFYINRIEKPTQMNAPKIPQRFAFYEKKVYYSDLSHPSEQENWKSFFPDRSARSDSCIMDYTLGRYKFDKLIARFMYDRLHAKIHRP